MIDLRGESKMRLKKLVALFCAFLMILTVMPNVVCAADITALDLSENKTRFTTVGEEGTLIVYGLIGTETERARSGLIDNSSLNFSSSNTAVFSVDENGAFRVNAEGLAIITVKYGSVANSMVIYCEDAANLFTADSSTTYIETAEDNFRGKSDVLKVKGGNMLNPKLSDTTYVMGGWFYDSADAVNTSISYKFGPRSSTSARILWGAYISTRTYMNANVMSCSDVNNTIAVKKDSRIKGWHQLFTVVQRVNSVTHYMTFFDGELVLKGTTSTEVTPYYIDNMDTLCQEVYIAPYSQAAFDVSSINIPDNATDVPVDTEFEINFNRALDDTSSVEFTLTDTVNNQEIELDTLSVSGNSVKVKPIYELAHDNSYSLTISGSAVSVEDMFSPSASVDLSEVISFRTEKPDLYAENLSISHTGTVDFSADIVNNASAADVWLIAAQYTATGVQKNLTVKKTAGASTGAALPVSSAPVVSGASVSEGYVWTGLNALEAKNLASPAVSGTYTRASADASTQISTYVDVGYSPDSGLVEVHGYSSSNRSGLPVLIRIINPNKDYTTVTESNVNDVYARVEQISTAAGGRFDYKFELDGEPGEYKVIVNLPFETAIEDEIRFASREDVYDNMGYVQNPETHPETTIPAEVFAKARLVLDMNYSIFDTLAHKSIVYSMMDTAEDFDTFREFSEFFADCVEIVSALETNDSSVIDAKKSEWGIGNLSVYANYKNMSTDEKTKIHKAILDSGFDSYTILCDKFAESVILDELKSINNYTEIYPILYAASDCFVSDSPTLDFAGYDNLSEAWRGEAMKEFSLKLADLSSKANIIEIFNTAVLNASYNENDDNNSSSGGGSPSYSGGFKGGSGNNKTEVINGNFTTGSENMMGSQTPEWVIEERELKTRKVFDDIDSVPWAEDAIRELYNRGIISGKAEGIFAPNDYLTREELVKMLLAAMNLETTGAEPVNMWDVNRNAWYAPYVDTAVASGIIQGIGDGSFGIGSLVNREEICVIADRAAQAGGIFLDDEFTIKSFSDEKQISSWAVYSVNKMRESFVITGVGGNYFEPKSLVTRAQAAKIIYGILAYAEI